LRVAAQADTDATAVTLQVASCKVQVGVKAAAQALVDEGDAGDAGDAGDC
jgi:hypothetical protein